MLLRVCRGDVTSAVLYATDIYCGRVLDRSAARTLRKDISTRIPDLIQRQLDFAMDGLASGRVAQLVGHYKDQLAVLIRLCVSTCHFDLLYNTVYRRVEKDGLAKGVFLEAIEEAVVEGRLDQPPPALVHDYLDYLAAEGQFSTFENVVTKFPIDRLDLHAVITTCRANKLFDGIIYVMNSALGDFISPLEASGRKGGCIGLQEMCLNLAEFVGKAVFSDFEVAQGTKLLLYLSACLAGSAYPFGELSAELQAVVPREVYKFLVSLRQDRIAALTGVERYPVLTLLLDFDAPQFLNVICTCADAPLFAQSDGRLKRLVHILIGLGEQRPDYARLLLPFITHLVQTSSVEQDTHTFQQLVLSVVARLLSTNDPPPAHAEQHVVELMRACQDFPLDLVLEQARKRPL